MCAVHSVKAQPPVVSGNATVRDGSTATLTCASASGPLPGASYVWRQNGAPVPGAASATYTTPRVTMASHGDAYTCAVTFNNVTSDHSTSPLNLSPVKLHNLNSVCMIFFIFNSYIKLFELNKHRKFIS